MTVSIGNGVDIGNLVTSEIDPVTGRIEYSTGPVQKRKTMRRRPTIVTSDAPTITYSATLPASGCALAPIVPNVRPVGCGVSYNSATSVYDLISKGGFVGIDFTLVGDTVSFVWKCDIATKERFMFYVDGFPVSLTPAAPSVTTAAGGLYVVNIVFGSAAKRRIEILGTSIKAFVRVVIPYTGQIAPAPKKRSIHIVGDSFNAGSNAISTNDQLPGAQLALIYDCSVSVNAYGGTGYVKTNGALTTFGEASRVAEAAQIQPDDIIIMGSVNDDGQSGVQSAVSAALSAYKAACTKSLLTVFGPQATNPTDTLSTARRDNCLAVRAACAGAVPYYEMCGFVDTTALRAFTQFVNYNAGELVTNAGSIWRHEATIATMYPNSGAPGQPGYQAWTLMSLDLFGTGKVGSTMGDGTRDTLLYSDNIHPTPMRCSMLGARIGQVAEDNSDF